MRNHHRDDLLTQSKELRAAATAAIGESNEATAHATELCAEARALVRLSQDTADVRHEERLTRIAAGKASASGAGR